MSLPTLDGSNNDKNKALEEDEDKSVGLPDFDMPPIEEEERDEFEEVDAGEALTYEDEDDSINEDVNVEIAKSMPEDESLPVMDSNENSDYFAEEDDYNPDYEEDIEEGKKHKFIDKKKKKIIPFGGKRSKRQIKPSELDDRKNVISKTKVVRFLIMSAIFILFLVGLKNTFFPSHVYTGDQIRQFAREGAGKTGFPEERGQAFVENFMQSYLEIDSSRPELSDAVSHYYGGSSFGDTNSMSLNVKLGNDVRQQVIVQPKVYEAKLLNEYSAQYKVNAFVTDTSGVGDVATGRWLAFVVNVYYDKTDDTLAITPDSPSIIPSYKINDQRDIPERVPFGNGEVNESIAPALNPTINGFIEAYAKSSLESHDSILQYVDNSKNVELYDGFGGSVELYDEPSTSIKKKIYNHEEGKYRVELTVDWLDTASARGANEIVYTSKYVMTVKSGEEGKYTVSEFSPYTYYKSEITEQE